MIKSNTSTASSSQDGDGYAAALEACERIQTARSHSYFVVMLDYGRRGREAIVDPEITRREVISRVSSGEYPIEKILFVHEINGADVLDITDDIIDKWLEAAPARALRNEGVG